MSMQELNERVDSLLDTLEMKFEALQARLTAVEAERDAARAGEARAVEALKEIAVFAQGLRERSDVSTFVVIGHMIEGYLNKHAGGGR